MDIQTIYYDKSEYVETATGNKVNRKSRLFGSQNIVLNGKSTLMKDCILRGDMHNIRTGRYCVVGERTIIRPSYKRFSKGLTFFPVHIGDHVFIGNDCIVMAAEIGAFVHIGHNSVIGRSVIIKSCVQVLPNTVVPHDAVIPPFSIVAGNPGTVIGHLPESTQELMTEATRNFYDNFVPDSKNPSIVT
uniref:Dynactin subunit 5 n=1 Tax=Onchocerca volvulus TaxID=6282 RepID=A0A8R1TQI4_ONCVO